MHLYIYILYNIYISIYIIYNIYICVCNIWPGHIPAYFLDLRPKDPASHRSSTAKHQVLHGFIVGGMHLSGIRWSKFPGLTGSSFFWSSWSAKSCGKLKTLNHLDPFGMIFTTQFWQSFKICLKAPPPAAFRVGVVGVVGVSSSQHPAAKRERSLWGFNCHNSFTEKTLPSYATAKKHKVFLVS